jgi:hypothetical protein
MHTNKTFFCLVVIVLIIGCSNKPISGDWLIGEYSDKKHFFLKELYLKYVLKEYKTLDNSLSLRSDSTYTYINCNTITHGSWSISLDTLLLTCLEAKWKNDSLFNDSIPSIECRKTPAKLCITKKGELKNKFEVNPDDNPTNRIMYAVTWLSKND